MPVSTIDPEPLVVSRSDTAKMLGLSQRQVDLLIEKGVLDSVRIGRRRMVPMGSVRRLAENGTS